MRVVNPWVARVWEHPAHSYVVKTLTTPGVASAMFLVEEGIASSVAASANEIESYLLSRGWECTTRQWL